MRDQNLNLRTIANFEAAFVYLNDFVLPVRKNSKCPANHFPGSESDGSGYRGFGRRKSEFDRGGR